MVTVSSFFRDQAITELTSSWDFDILESALSTLVTLCLPSNSSFLEYTSVEAELKNNVELPSTSTDTTLALFTGFSLSSPEYGMMDYLKSQAIPPYSLIDEEIYLSLNNGEVVNLSLSSSLEKTLFRPETGEEIDSFFKCLREKDILGKESLDSRSVMILASMRAAVAFHSPLERRITLAILRLKCFYILIHSRVHVDHLQAYLVSGCVFLKDLMALSDLNSEMTSEIREMSPVCNELSRVAMACLLDLLALVMRRRLLSNVSGVLQDLGLRPGEARGRRDEHFLMSQEIGWMAIVSSSCGVAFDSLQCMFHTLSETDIQNLASYIDSGLELFLRCVTSTDVSSISQVTPVVISVASIVRISIEKLPEILSDIFEYDGNRFVQSRFVKAVSFIKLLVKAISCCGFLLDKGTIRGQPSYASILLECDFLSSIGSVLEVFDASGCKTTSEKWSPWLNHLLEGSFLFLARHYKFCRSRSSIGNTSELGINIVNQKYFFSIAHGIFSGEARGQEMLWDSLYRVLKEAVDLDPSVLSSFLNAPFLSVAFVRFHGTQCLLEEVGVKCHEFLPFLSKFIRAISITADGLDLISRHHVVSFIINAVVSESALLPRSCGISQDSVMNVGKTLALLVRDNERLREVTNIMSAIL